VDALTFLADSKKSGLKLDLGATVAVIGGGDVAMDCARAARRNAGVKKVTIVYRRTREFMPAQAEELKSALEDGVEFDELLAPVSFKDGKLTCEKQRLGDRDASGRRGIVGTGENVIVSADTVISATGAKVDASLFKANGLALTSKGTPVVNEHGESSVAGVYVAGDCKKGAATVVRAIADAAAVAADILEKLGLKPDVFVNEECCIDESDLYFKKGVLVPAKNDASDAYRCLRCDTVCEICVDVCPNRANTVVVEESGAHQVVHVDRMCNECGNCATFCPQGGKPYREKFTVFACDEDFEHSENPGFITIGGKMKLRGSDSHCKDFADFVAANHPELGGKA
jgi:putative selenate reductase